MAIANKTSAHCTWYIIMPYVIEALSSYRKLNFKLPHNCIIVACSLTAWPYMEAEHAITAAN